MDSYAFCYSHGKTAVRYINCQLYFVCLYPVILVYELSILDRSCDTDLMVYTQLVIDLLQ